MVMAVRKPEQLEPCAPAAEVFDREFLAHYTMDSAELEREIIGLFLAQLPVTIEMIEQAGTPAEWKLASHTLKGAAAAIGAGRLRAIAVELELLPVGAATDVRAVQFAALAKAADEFRDAVRHIYP